MLATVTIHRSSKFNQSFKAKNQEHSIGNNANHIDRGPKMVRTGSRLSALSNVGISSISGKSPALRANVRIQKSHDTTQRSEVVERKAYQLSKKVTLKIPTQGQTMADGASSSKITTKKPSPRLPKAPATSKSRSRKPKSNSSPAIS